MGAMRGGCLCGGVRYEVDAEPLVSALCHCRDCQRFTGSAFVSAMIVPRDRVRVEGELRVYESVGGSGRTFRRHFCPNCGSSVFGEGTVRPGTINIMAGTLDDPSAYRPASEIFCDFAVPWLEGRDSRNRLPQGFYGPRTEP